MPRIEFVAEPREAGLRLDVCLAARAALSRSRIAALIADGRAFVSGKPAAKAGLLLSCGAPVALDVPEPAPSALVPEDIPLDVLYEDADLLAVNKPAGLVVHPSAGHDTGTLVHALLHRCRDLSGIGGELRPGIVHRLDKDTSGVLVIAKDDRTHRALGDQLKNRTVLREYQAVVVGIPKEAGGLISAPVGRDPKDRKRMAVAPGGREAITEWETLEVFPALQLALVRCRLHTGRTHQIRVHMAHIHHPVLMDPVYLPRAARPPRAAALPIARQALHACLVGFDHPRTGRPLRIEAPFPADMLALVSVLRGERG